MAKVVLENIYKSFPLRQGEQEKAANNVAESVSPDALALRLTPFCDGLT